MSIVIALFEALGTKGHTWRYTASSTTIRDEIWGPDQTACCGIIEGSNYSREFIRGPAPGHEPLAPVNGLPLVDGLARVEKQIEELIEVVRRRRPRAISVDVSRSPTFALFHQHVSRNRIRGHFYV